MSDDLDLDSLYETLPAGVASADDLAEHLDCPVDVVREVLGSLEIPKFGNAFAVTREKADDVCDELDSLGWFSDDEDTDEETDEDQD